MEKEINFRGTLFGSLSDVEKVELKESTFKLLSNNNPYTNNYILELNIYGSIYKLSIEIRQDVLMDKEIQIILSRNNFDKERLKHQNKIYNNADINVSSNYDAKSISKISIHLIKK